jgi:hypothetical protein
VGEGVGVLGGELFQGVDKFSGARDAERDGLSAGFLGALPGGLDLPLAAFAVGAQRVVGRVVTVLGLGAAIVARRSGGLVTAGVSAVLGGGDYCDASYSISFHCDHAIL